MPANCSDRTVNCVLDDGAPTVQQAAPIDTYPVPMRDGPPRPSQLPSGPGADRPPADGDTGPARGRRR
ncbi:MAG TPA: hypothetical protein VHP37_33430 [Burkholderiales bacterium]|nr:hypothetical protein [Burkholderiales bacterium]